MRKIYAVFCIIIESCSPVTMGEYVLIGAQSLLLPGVVIGNGAVIAMESVVTKSVLNDAVVAGNLARIIMYRDCNVYKQKRN